MPLYDFACECGNTFERMVPVDERHEQPCGCGKSARRLYTGNLYHRFGRDGRIKGPGITDGRVNPSRNPTTFGYGSALPKTGGSL